MFNLDYTVYLLIVHTQRHLLGLSAAQSDPWILLSSYSTPAAANMRRGVSPRPLKSKYVYLRLGISPVSV